MERENNSKVIRERSDIIENKIHIYLKLFFE